MSPTRVIVSSQGTESLGGGRFEDPDPTPSLNPRTLLTIPPPIRVDLEGYPRSVTGDTLFQSFRQE